MTPVFEFDLAKSASNRVKHGIDFMEVQELWHSGGPVLLPSQTYFDEVRWLAIGRFEGKTWTVIHAMRGDVIRIISARRSRRNEESYYESQRSRQEI
jgi:uncharacterized protein